MNERTIQQYLMSEVLNGKNHVAAVPNSQYLLLTEADLLSVTRAHLVHEFEIKCSVSDYNRDFKSKVWKHMVLKSQGAMRSRRGRCPNYFWFVTYDFDIDPPEYAGWIKAVPRPYDSTLALQYKKQAPRLHENKWDDAQVAKIARLLSFRLLGEWRRYANV